MIQVGTARAAKKHSVGGRVNSSRVLDPVTAAQKRSELAELSDQELSRLPDSSLLQIIRQTLPDLYLTSVDRELLLKVVKIVRTDCRAELLNARRHHPAWV